jgi:hypothetical protein
LSLTDLIIVSPVYNDWDCAEELIGELDKSLIAQGIRYHLVLVDDGSQMAIPQFVLDRSIIIQLVRNMGHQKAIAIGLAYVAMHFDSNRVVVMDSDGEDRPSDIPSLLSKAVSDPDKIWFAQRRKRQESNAFKFLYFFYKLAFKTLTGYLITFGNFVLIPMDKLKRLVYVTEIWNHFPGGIIRSKLPYDSVPIDRGSRYKGQSKMNTVSLIQHGLSSITVNMDIVAVRMLVFSFVLMSLTSVILFVIFGIRIFTDLAIPGWTSEIGIGLVIILVLAFFFSLLLTFTILSSRIQHTFIPAKDYQTFIYRVINKEYVTKEE